MDINTIFLIMGLCLLPLFVVIMIAHFKGRNTEGATFITLGYAIYMFLAIEGVSGYIHNEPIVTIFLMGGFYAFLVIMLVLIIIECLKDNTKNRGKK